MNFAADVLPLLSVAEQVTRVFPNLKRLPDRGLHVTGRGPSASSLAVTVNLTRTVSPFAVRLRSSREPRSVSRSRTTQIFCAAQSLRNRGGGAGPVRAYFVAAGG